jgi:MFS family permease
MIADRVGSIKLLVVLALTQGPIYYLIVFMPYGLGFAALMLAFGIQQSMRSPTSEFFIIEIVPPHLRSTVLGIYFFAGMELSGLIMPVLGAMIDRNGFHATFGLTAIIIFVLSLLFTPVLMMLKRMAERIEDLNG